MYVVVAPVFGNAAIPALASLASDAVKGFNGRDFFVWSRPRIRFVDENRFGPLLLVESATRPAAGRLPVSVARTADTSSRVLLSHRMRPHEDVSCPTRQPDRSLI